MTSIPSGPSGAPAPRLPESLVRQIRAFEARLRRLETITAVCGALLGLAATFGLLFLSDRAWETPGALRLALSLGGAVAVSWGSVFWFKRWVVARRGPRDLARLIQRGFPEMGDRLLGVVELTEGDRLPEGVSPALVRAAVAQVSNQAGKMRLDEAAPSRLPHRVALACVALVALAALPFALAPSAARNALQRLLNPLGEVRRFTFVSLKDLPDEIVVPHGEAFEIVCQVADDSERKPVSAEARFEDQPPLDSAFADGVATFQVPGQTKTGKLVIQAGDTTKRTRIVPSHRPELVGLEATVTLPGYLSREPETRALHGATASVLEGSQVAFTGKVSRPLREARIVETPATPPRVERHSFATAPLPAANGQTLTFDWRDEKGLAPARPFALTVDTFADEKPSVEFREVSRTLAILPEEIVKLPVRAEDDFGLRSVKVSWQAAPVDAKAAAPAGPAAEEPVGEGSPTTLRVDGDFTFSPLMAKVPEDSVVTVQARAADYHPTREAGVSPAVKIFVLNPAKHAKMVQEMMERLLSRVEELAREEENLQLANESQLLKPDAELAQEPAGQQAREAQAAEERNRRHLDELAREAEKIMKEALRNKEVPESTLREWNEIASDMQQVSSENMQQAAQSLSQAAQKPGERKKETAKAVAQEKEAVKKLREMEKKMDRSIESMLAQSFVNRLRQASRVEKGVAGELAAAVPEILGQMPEEMTEDKRGFVRQVADRQQENRQQAGYIQDDLGGFFNRTRKEDYGSIYKDMLEKKTTQALETITGHIRENLAGKSIPGAQRWEQQFTAWADQLEAANKKNGNSSEGEEGEEVDMEVLIALMRARHLEEGIREQTRMLDQHRPVNPAWAQDAKKLAKSQFAVSDDIGRIETRIKQDQLRALATKVSGEMMNAGVRLREPRTDQETVAIQTEIIELLSSLINQCNGSQSKAGQKMMMAMGMGRTGGGSLAGGTTNQAAIPSQGAALGASPDERGGRKGSGVDGDLPEEFREAIESFFQGLETVN